MSKGTIGIVGGLLGLILFLSANTLFGDLLRSMRLDLTEDKLYTLSEGSRQIARNIDEPLHFYFYRSEKTANEVYSAQQYGARVREVLEEFVAAADGKIVLHRIDPESFSEDEDRATAEGMQGFPLPTGESLFLGLVATNSVDETEVIPFFDPGKERFLEYDIAKIIYSLSQERPPVIGVLSSLPIQGSPRNPMQPGSGGPWYFVEQLQSLAETRFLDQALETVPEDVEVLMVVHPKGLADTTLYAIDQYVLAGGKAIVFVDPHCEADDAGADPMDPRTTMGRSKASELSKLFRAWGIEMVPDRFVGDRGNAIEVDLGTPLRPRRVSYIAYVTIAGDSLAEDDITTSLLSRLNFGAAGALRPLPDAETTFLPLVRSSEDAMLADVSALQGPRPDPERLLTSFIPDNERFTLAARVTGITSSAFPDGSPSAPPDAEGDTASAHLAVASSPINVLVVADCDMLRDGFWISRPFGSRAPPVKSADNGDFVSNAAENYSSGDDLISIRAHGRYRRPFDMVDERRREAEQLYLHEREELKRKQEQITTQINDIIRGRGATDGQVLITPEEYEELLQKEEEQQEIRRKQRDVEYNLRKDIEKLGKRVKWVNILAVPGLVAVTALALGALRVQRRSRTRRGK